MDNKNNYSRHKRNLFNLSENLDSKIRTASKWSAITEIVAKLVSPITGIVLAHILTPEAFGIVATLTMIISFAEIFTDAGFQKYLIQHEFIDERDREESTTVAFWSNLVMSLIIWAIIAIVNEPLARIVGNPGLGYVIVIACVSIPMEAFSSIQMALYKRDFDFKTLFKARMVGIVIPLIVTIPLALWLRNFWALVIGTISTNTANAILLTYYSNWKPRLYFSFDKLKEMLSFTIWSMIETISIWLNGYVDVFIVGTMLNQHYLGLYKTASTLVGQIMGLITSATTPILFSSLSRLQNDRNDFKRIFFKFQHIVAILVFPIGVIIFCYSDFITDVILGKQWMEAAGFVGLWGLTSAIAIVLSHYSSEAYRSIGRPKLSVLAQWLHLIVLWPSILISVRYGFEALYVTRSLVRFEMIAVQLAIMYVYVNFSPVEMFKNIGYPLFASCVMMLLAFAIRNISGNIFWQILSILICFASYIGIIAASNKDRNILINLTKYAN